MTVKLDRFVRLQASIVVWTTLGRPPKMNALTTREERSNG